MSTEEKNITLTKEEFIKLYLSKTNKECADELNIPLIVFYQMLKEYGINKNRKNKTQEIKIEENEEPKPVDNLISIAISKAKIEVQKERTKLIHPQKKEDMLRKIDDAVRNLDYQDLLNQDFSKYGKMGYFYFFKTRLKSKINDYLKNK